MTSEPRIQQPSLPDDDFRAALARGVDEYRAHFGPRLVAVYVWGSVHRQEAVRRVSDLDLTAFTTDGFRDTDEAWRRAACERLPLEFPGLHGLTRPRRVEDLPLVANRALRFRLRYDTTLVWGRDLLSGLADVPVPDRQWGRLLFPSPWHLVLHAAGWRRDKGEGSDFDLPEEPALRLRKLVRLAVLGGASFLMAYGRFESYRGAHVLPALRELREAWRPFLWETEQLFRALHQPVEHWPAELGTDKAVSGYLGQLVGWMDVVGAELEIGQTGE